MNTWIPDFETLLQLGSLEMNWSSESDVEGKKYIFACFFFPQRSQNRRVGDKIWDLCDSELQPFGILPGSDLTSEFFPLSYHCQVERHFSKMRVKLRGENKALSEFLGPGDRRSDRCGKRSALCLSLPFYFLSAKVAEKSCHVPETQAGSVSSCL